MTKSRFFISEDVLIVIIPPNADICNWPCVFSSMRNCTLRPQSHFAVVCLWCSDPTGPWAVEKQLCSHYFYFWRSAWGNRNMICRLWFLKLFFLFIFFFFFGYSAYLHRKLWIGIFVSFYSKFLLSHPPNLEPETTILPHPNSAGRSFMSWGWETPRNVHFCHSRFVELMFSRSTKNARTLYYLHSNKLISTKLKKQDVNCVKSPCGCWYGA